MPKKATISERSNNTIIDESPDVKPIFEKNQENLRFSLKNGENAPQVDTQEFKNWFKDSNNWIETFLTPAIEAEKKGIGILYFDEEKASKYNALSKRKGIIPTGFIHNIAQLGLNVKSDCCYASEAQYQKFLII